MLFHSNLSFSLRVFSGSPGRSLVHQSHLCKLCLALEVLAVPTTVSGSCARNSICPFSLLLTAIADSNCKRALRRAYKEDSQQFRNIRLHLQCTFILLLTERLEAVSQRLGDVYSRVSLRAAPEQKRKHATSNSRSQRCLACWGRFCGSTQEWCLCFMFAVSFRGIALPAPDMVFSTPRSQASRFSF